MNLCRTCNELHIVAYKFGYYINVGGAMLALYTKYTCVYGFDLHTRRILLFAEVHASTLYCILCVGSMSRLSVYMAFMLESYEYSVCV